jgi:uncharacterized protein YaiE (UPF0345 family)
MTTKIKSGVIGDNVVGITQLNVSDGTNGQVLTTDGSGTLSFSTVSGTTINNNADNRIITGSGTANTLNGESTLTFDGSNLNLNTTSPTLTIESGDAQDSKILFIENGNNAVSLFYEGSAGTGIANNLHIRSELSGSETNLVTFGLDGDVGIGASSPSAKLHIDSTGDALKFTRTSEETYLIEHGTSGLYTKLGSTIATGITQDHDFGVYNNAGTRYLFCDGSTSRVGIGTINGSGKLSIQDTTNINTGSNYANKIAPLVIGDVDSTGPCMLIDGNQIESVANPLYLNNNSSFDTFINVGGGNVGIGTTSPTFSAGGGLNVAQATFATIRARGGASTGVDFAQASDGKGYVYVRDNADLIFGTNNTERMRIDSAGRVGIGTSSPDSTAKLHIKSNTEGTSGDAVVIIEADQDNNNENDNPRLEFWQDGRAVKAVLGYDDNDFQIFNMYSAGQLEFGTASTTRMTIASNGSIGAPSGTNIYNASDERLKQNISTLSNSLDVINALNPVQFNWIENFEESENGKNLYGFIAQEVQDVFPDAVESFGNSVEVDGTVIENPLTVRDKFFIPVLVKAIQELKTELDAAKARIETLEG